MSHKLARYGDVAAGRLQISDEAGGEIVVDREVVSGDEGSDPVLFTIRTSSGRWACLTEADTIALFEFLRPWVEPATTTLHEQMLAQSRTYEEQRIVMQREALAEMLGMATTASNLEAEYLIRAEALKAAVRAGGDTDYIATATERFETYLRGGGGAAE